LKIYPNILRACPIEYQWEEFDSVTLFASGDYFADLVGWYREQYPGADFRPQDDGRFEVYEPNRMEPRSSLLMVDLTVPAALPILDAYLGSKRLREMACLPGVKAVGALFRHK
jgi:hypothetical protein